MKLISFAVYVCDVFFYNLFSIMSIKYIIIDGLHAEKIVAFQDLATYLWLMVFKSLGEVTPCNN